MSDEAHAPEPSDAAAAPPPKRDPEAFTLRGKPARAIRFRRPAVAALAAGAAIVVAGTAWVSLRVHSPHPVPVDNAPAVAAATPIDTLSSLPANYGSVPKLGQPLPGDLGRPILDRQRQLATEAAAPQPATSAPTIDEERQRRLAAIKAARESGLLVSSARAGNTEVGATALPVSPPADPTVGSTPMLDPERDSNAQQRKASFTQAVDPAGDRNPHSLVAAGSPYTLSAGTVVAASLITGLRSDLPGLVVAQVTERVFDSATGQHLLIPQGARLIGSYDSVVAFGQRRALVVWQRIVFPDGSSLRLDNAPASDPAGYAGLSDQVDLHTWTLLKGVALSTLLGVGAELQFSGEGDLVQALRQSTQQNASRAADQLTSRNLQVQPTLTVRPGARVRLIVHRDLVLKPWEEL